MFVYNFNGMLEYGNDGMMGKPNIGSGGGTRLRALDEQTLVPPEWYLLPVFQDSSIPLFLMLPACFYPALTVGLLLLHLLLHFKITLHILFAAPGIQA